MTAEEMRAKHGSAYHKTCGECRYFHLIYDYPSEGDVLSSICRKSGQDITIDWDSTERACGLVHGAKARE